MHRSKDYPLSVRLQTSFHRNVRARPVAAESLGQSILAVKYIGAGAFDAVKYLRYPLLCRDLSRIRRDPPQGTTERELSWRRLDLSGDEVRGAGQYVGVILAPPYEVTVARIHSKTVPSECRIVDLDQVRRRHSFRVRSICTSKRTGVPALLGEQSLDALPCGPAGSDAVLTAQIDKRRARVQKRYERR